MFDFLRLLCGALVGLFRSSAQREAEILVLRHQINVLRRQAPRRPALDNVDRLLIVWLTRLVPTTLKALAVITPETVVRWQRAGFRAYWRFKSRPRGGRPKTPLEIRQLIRDMSRANPLWGAPRIHGELLKLGIDVGQTTVAKYMDRCRRPPSQGWSTFLRNHADGNRVGGMLILHHGRRQILWPGVTAHPTAEWIAHQFTEACGWKVAPQYLVRDRDGVYGDVFIRRLRAMGIRDRPTAVLSPWQNGYAEG